MAAGFRIRWTQVLRLHFSQKFLWVLEPHFTSSVLGAYSRSIESRARIAEENDLTNPTNAINLVIAALRSGEGQLTERAAAMLVFRSPRRFRALFLQSTGASFRVVRLRIKMECAQNLLRETQMAIHAISERLHYKSSEKFARSFKRQFGLTPSEYRQQPSSTTEKTATQGLDNLVEPLLACAPRTARRDASIE
jgi:AraC-like DNA-binding protein